MTATMLMAKRFSPTRLRRFREAKGLTEAQLAVKADCSDEQIKNLEKPATETSKGPHANLLSAIADALGVKIDRLFED